MPRNYTQTVYTFAELKELGDSRAIERASQWLRDGATMDDFWSEYVIEEWKTALAQIGFDNVEISYSGFWSQGDGASFTASVDLTKLIDFLAAPPAASNVIAGEPEDFRPWIVEQCKGVRSNPKFSRLHWIELDGAKVTRDSHHYSHENTCSFQAEDLRDKGEYVPTEKHPSGYGNWESYTPRVRQLYDDFVEAAEELRRDLCRAIYRSLNDEYDYRTGDEAIAEDADANGWTFTSSGRREG